MTLPPPPPEWAKRLGSIFKWEGKPVDECTREELLECVKFITDRENFLFRADSTANQTRINDLEQRLEMAQETVRVLGKAVDVLTRAWEKVTA